MGRHFLSTIILTALAGIFCFAQEGSFSFSLSNPQVTAITQDNDGFIWFGTIRGLNRFNGASYTAYYASGEDGDLSNDHIISLCLDSEGILWIGTECGVNYYRDGRFYQLNSNTVYEPVNDLVEISPSIIGFSSKSGLYQVDKRTLVITKSTVPLTFYRRDLEHQRFQFRDRDGGIWTAGDISGWMYQSDNMAFKGEVIEDSGARISYLMFDQEGYLWMRVGMLLCSFDPKTGQVVWRDDRHSCASMILDSNSILTAIVDKKLVNKYKLSGGIPHLISSIPFENELFSISRDSERNIWISESSTLIQIDQSGNISRFPIEKEHSFTAIIPAKGAQRIFLLGTTEGLLEMKPGGKLQPLGPGFKNISSILVSRDGSLWMGTYNDGLIHYNENDGTIEKFGREEGIIGVNIKSMVQDTEGNIWFSTDMYISRFDPVTQTFSALNDSRYRRDGKFYDLISATLGPDGLLYFGGAGGLTVVNPKLFKPQDSEIPLLMESISVNGRGIWEKTPRLDLKNTENTLGFRFRGIDYQSGLLLNYAWKLDGYDLDWHSGVPMDVSYVRLPAGSYTFKAKVRLQNGEWSKSLISIPIIIHPAPFASPLAVTIYFVLGLLLLAFIILLFIRYKIQKERLILVNEKDELNQQHIHFMTNISHELRTPLSLIFAPVKSLQKSDLPPRDKEMVNHIFRGAEQMRILTEQLLQNYDLHHKSDALHIRENDLAATIRHMTDMFLYSVAEKDLQIETDIPECLICWYDSGVVSKMFGNLLTNAIKYTPDSGHISVSLKKEDGQAIVSVADDGIGVPVEKRERLFVRFDRLGAEKSGIAGTGIGLNYVSQLSVLHRGKVWYEPNYPCGSIFSFSLPITSSAYSDLVTDNQAPLYVPSDNTPTETIKERTIMIVEDNADIRSFLRNLFQENYNVITASNGLEAIDDLRLGLPDIVLSDVIMPGKDGFSLCSEIKANPDWNHLPVILLTAKSDTKSSIEGLGLGADLYVSKPFDPDFLIASVESLVRNRVILQEKIRNLTSKDLQDAETDEAVALSTSEKDLLQKIHTYLDSNLDNETMDVAGMAKELGMSYSSLYSRVKVLTGVTPKAYITSYRMNIARKLLLEGGYTVSEVADMVGSSSPFTFSREFKNFFGYPPINDKKT